MNGRGAQGTDPGCGSGRFGSGSGLGSDPGFRSASDPTVAPVDPAGDVPHPHAGGGHHP